MTKITLDKTLVEEAVAKLKSAYGFMDPVAQKLETALGTAEAAASAPAAEPAPGIDPAVVAGKLVTLNTDGACSGNPGPMGLGWAASIDGALIGKGSVSPGNGTNQLAEILAAATGLEALPPGTTVRLRTDSLYVVNTMTQGWKRKSNIEAWDRLDRAVARHASVAFEHVKGHNGDKMNELADTLAVAASKRAA